MIKLTGHIDVPNDRLQNIKAGLPKHIKLTHAEAGNVSFSVTPCPKVIGRFLVQEVFIDQSAFDYHQNRTAGSDWAIISKDIPREYQISEIE